MLTINRAEQYVRWMFKVRGVGIAFIFCWNRPLGCITLDGQYRRFFCGKERDWLAIYLSGYDNSKKCTVYAADWKEAASRAVAAGEE